MGEDKIEFIALLSQDNMKFLQKVWVEEEKDKKNKTRLFSLPISFSSGGT